VHIPEALGAVSIASATVVVLAVSASFGGWVDWFDHRVQAAFLQVVGAHTTSVMLGISWFGGRGSLYAALLICVILLLRHEWTWLMTFVLAAASHDRVTVFLKGVVHRPRPHIVHPLLNMNDYSFPSGHVLAATLIYGWLATYAVYHVRDRRKRVAAVASCLVIIVLVGASRMYLQVHYFSDVLAGGITGAACLLCSIAFVGEFQSFSPMTRARIVFQNISRKGDTI
jgi:undecaprenyl-diphosphatase